VDALRDDGCLDDDVNGSRCHSASPQLAHGMNGLCARGDNVSDPSLRAEIDRSTL